MRFIILCLLSTFFFSTTAHAIDTVAQHAIVMDANTGTVLYEKAPDELMHPASMTKMMTAYMVFDALKRGTLTMDQTFLVSRKAWKMGGSKMFVEIDKQVSIHDLIQGLVVQSGNDAAIVLAEGMAGTEDDFSVQMTEMAHAIGMKNSTFKNSNGWPADGHMTTARDMAILADKTIRNFPEYYPFYNEREFTFSNIHQMNRNPLFKTTEGADGLKTGYTEEAGYSVTGSAIRNGRRIIVVIAGCKTALEREAESKKLIDWAFREFNNYALFKAGQTIAEIPVWLGRHDNVPLVAAQDTVATLPVMKGKGYTAEIRYQSPVEAPVKTGDTIAEFVVEHPLLKKPFIIPLQAGRDIPRVSLVPQFKRKIKFLFFGDIS